LADGACSKLLIFLLAGYAAHVGKMRYKFRILIGIPEAELTWQNLEIDGRTILN
jgi:hypothetical protein